MNAFFKDSPMHRCPRYQTKGGHTGDLLTVNNDAKTVKGNGQGIATAILYLAPAENLQTAIESGLYVARDGLTRSYPSACSASTPGCESGCLYKAGRGRFASVEGGRLRKTDAYHSERADFVACLSWEIGRHVARSTDAGLIPAVRLDGTSDLAWETVAPLLMDFHPSATFYDYTKNATRIGRYSAGQMPANYHLTYSVSERSGSLQFGADYARSGGVSAVVVHGGYDAVLATVPHDACPDFTNGDATDARFLESGSMAILSPKGPAKSDRTGFVFCADDFAYATSRETSPGIYGRGPRKSRIVSL